MKVTLNCLFLLLCINSTFAGDLDQEIENVRKVIKQRQEKRLKYQSELIALNEKAKDLSQKKVSVDSSNIVSFGQEPLRCKEKRFNWRTALPTSDFRDCEFKYNIGSPEQIKAFYAAIEKFRSDGWDVIESKHHKQIRLSEKLIWNYERYRFVKSKKDMK